MYIGNFLFFARPNPHNESTNDSILQSLHKRTAYCVFLTEMFSLLIVDDQPNIRMLLQEYFTEQGFGVQTAQDGRDALLKARQFNPDLVLLDITMPHLDGYEFMEFFRRERQTPVILLTALLEESNKMKGFDLGADDYVTKPFSLKELEARIRAVLRRTKPEATAPPSTLRIGDVILDMERRLVSIAEMPIELTPTEFELLALFMQHVGRAFSRMDLLEALDSLDKDTTERTVDVHIRNLRLKIEPDPKQPRYIETVFGVGYRFRSI